MTHCSLNDIASPFKIFSCIGSLEVAYAEHFGLKNSDFGSSEQDIFKKFCFMLQSGHANIICGNAKVYVWSVNRFYENAMLYFGNNKV